MPPCREALPYGLVLRSVRDEGDVERFVALNHAVTGEGAICERLLRHHPATRYDDYLLVEDTRSGEVVSTTCLLPWHLRYEDVVLNAAMLEMVVTHPDYRHRGLIRAQIARFHQVVDERGFELSIVQGIPYYYRQYGYAYALDHTPGDALPAWCIPDQLADAPSRYALRLATADDVATLSELYQAAADRYPLAVLRTPEAWQYLLCQAQYPVRLVEDLHTQRAEGYICAPPVASGQHVRVSESEIASYEAGMVVLRQLKTEAPGEIQLVGSTAHMLVRIGRSLGSQPLPSGQWLLRISCLPRFLSKIGPVLERRLARSGCVDLTTELRLNLYRQAYVLSFSGGKLRVVEPAGFVDASMGADGGDLCIPRDAFVRLLFGYRTLDELRDAWPDTIVQATSRYVLEALFPRLQGYISMPY